MSIKTMKFEEFLDELFRLKVLYPPHKNQEELINLICFMFPGQKEKTDEVLIHRLERVLNDLDHIYVNIVRMLRSKDYEK
jgi:hypothetical protein